MSDNGDLTLEQMERLVRDRIDRIDNEIHQGREQRAALMVTIKRLEAERAKAARMLPRASRRRTVSEAIDAQLT